MEPAPPPRSVTSQDRGQHTSADLKKALAQLEARERRLAQAQEHALARATRFYQRIAALRASYRRLRDAHAALPQTWPPASRREPPGWGQRGRRSTGGWKSSGCSA